jgi:hypothetical protein
MVGFGALYYRYTSTDPRLKPSPVWDVALVISFAGLVVAGLWGGWPDFIEPIYRFVTSPFTPA